MKVCSLCLLPSCSKLRVLGSPRLWPHPGLRQLGWGHLPADLHRAGPVGSKEDQQCSHCKSTPCLRVGGALRARHVSAVHSLENGRSGVTAVRWATRGVLSRHSWESRSEPLCPEARQRLHPGRPGCTCLIQPRAVLALVPSGQGGPGHCRVATGSLPACRPCCAHRKLSWPAVTMGTPGPEWYYGKHHRKLVLCFL